jgi:hypothetical protein
MARSFTSGLDIIAVLSGRVWGGTPNRLQPDCTPEFSAGLTSDSRELSSSRPWHALGSSRPWHEMLSSLEAWLEQGALAHAVQMSAGGHRDEGDAEGRPSRNALAGLARAARLVVCARGMRAALVASGHGREHGVALYVLSSVRRAPRTHPRDGQRRQDLLGAGLAGGAVPAGEGRQRCQGSALEVRGKGSRVASAMFDSSVSRAYSSRPLVYTKGPPYSSGVT